MVIALDPKRTWDFILPDERDLKPEDQTTFHLRALTPPELAEVTDMGIVHDKLRGTVQMKSAAQVLRILELGMAGWSNMKNASGVAVEPPAEPMERIALLPETVRAEVAAEIRFNAELTADEGN